MAASNSHDLSKSHDSLKADLWVEEGKLALVVGADAVLLEIAATESYLETFHDSQPIGRQCAALSRILLIMGFFLCNTIPSLALRQK